MHVSSEHIKPFNTSFVRLTLTVFTHLIISDIHANEIILINHLVK
jgi:hypothetical protein